METVILSALWCIAAIFWYVKVYAMDTKNDLVMACNIAPSVGMLANAYSLIAVLIDPKTKIGPTMGQWALFFSFAVIIVANLIFAYTNAKTTVEGRARFWQQFGRWKYATAAVVVLAVISGFITYHGRADMVAKKLQTAQGTEDKIDSLNRLKRSYETAPDNIDAATR